MQYKLLYSRRKTLSLSVDDDGIPLVKAPIGLPKAEIERFLEHHRAWLSAAKERQAKRRALDTALTEARIAELRARAKREIPPRVAHFAAILGVQPAGIRITSAKKRFGSCSGTDHLCFSWRLMLYPNEAVDYVVVHELAHIREKNHSPAVYNVVAAVLPDYKRRAALLRDIPLQGGNPHDT